MKKTGLFLFLIFSSFLFSSCTSTYFGRWAFWGPASITDYKEFPSRDVNTSSSSFQFKTDTLAAHKFSNFLTAYRDTIITQNGENKIENLLTSTGSTAFLVARGDTLLYENYFNGYERNSINGSFSVAKSFTSALIGIAIDEGLIRSVDDPITTYLPELKDSACASITIRHLLRMSSGIQYTDCGWPWCDEPKTYFDPHLRNLALNVEVKNKPNQAFHYNNYHPLLLGMILERVTHQSVCSYLQKNSGNRLVWSFPVLGLLIAMKMDLKKWKATSMHGRLIS
ncbi:MAG: serine hydrolase domain-containing protein [Bacteroidota bacterium]